MANDDGINYFDKKASNLDGFFEDPSRGVLRRDIDLQIETLEEKKGKPLKILDLGSGLASHAAYYAKQGHSVHAVEPAENMYNKAIELHSHPNIKHVNDSAPSLSKVEGEKFDLIYSIAALQYVLPEERQETFERLVNLLEEGGKLTMVYPYPRSREFQHDLLPEEIKGHIDKINEDRPEGEKIHVTIGEPIKDPANRKGIDEGSGDVYFQSVTAHHLGKLKHLPGEDKGQQPDSPSTTPPGSVGKG